MRSMLSQLAGFILSCCLLAGCTGKTVLQGKVVIAEQKLPYLAHQAIFLKKDQKTFHATKIDKYGFFEFRNVRKNKNYSIEFDTLSRMLNGSIFYIANLKGEKIKEINLSKGFAFELLPVEFYGLTTQDDNLEEMIRTFNTAPGNELLVKKYINYETGSYLITKENRKYMNTIARILKKNQQFILKVNSHADANGDDEFNRALSVKRASEIKNYLVKKGIASDRIMTYGYGETKPLNHCTNGVACSEILHKQNRRTEFVFKVKASDPVRK